MPRYAHPKERKEEGNQNTKVNYGVQTVYDPFTERRILVSLEKDHRVVSNPHETPWSKLVPGYVVGEVGGIDLGNGVRATEVEPVGRENEKRIERLVHDEETEGWTVVNFWHPPFLTLKNS